MGKSNGENSTRNLIIEVLGNRFPLTLKQVYNEVKKSKNVSYQGVYKVLNHLVEENVLEKIEKQYLLEKEWVDHQTKLFFQAYTNYNKVNYNPNQIDDRIPIQVFKFNSLKEMIDFFVEVLAKSNLKNEKVFISLRRLHPIIPPSMIPVIHRFTKGNDVYVLSKNKGFADKWMMRLLKGFGVNVKIGAQIAHQNAICFGGLVMQYFVFFPDTYKQKVHAFSDDFKSVSKLKLMKMTSDILYRRADMYIILNRYPVFVNDIMNTMEREFGNV